MRKLAKIFSSVIVFFWSFISWRLNKYLGIFLAFLWIDIFQIRKKVIYENIEKVFPNMSEVSKKKLARQSMASLCRSFFDVILIPKLSDGWIQKNVIFHGEDFFNKYQEQGKGILFLTLHLGSGDLGAAVISHKIWPCTLITKRFKSDFLDQFWFSLRGQSRTEFIDAHSKKNAFDILSALKKKRGVIFVLDQFMGKPYGVETHFFGHSTGTAYGLALFAKKTNLPVMPIYTYWDSFDKLHIHFGEVIALPKDISETKNEELTQLFNNELEKIITAHPEHWMWVHRRWKKFE